MSSEPEGESTEKIDEGAEGDDESDPPPPPKQNTPKKNPPKKKPRQKGIRIQDPTAAPTPREPIDTTHLVMDPPLASAPPVPPRRSKPSAAAKGKQTTVPEDKETLNQRHARLAEQKSLEATELEKAKLLNFYATAEHKKAEVAKQLGIVHLVDAKYDTQRRLAQAEEGEKRAAAAAAARQNTGPKCREEKDPRSHGHQGRQEEGQRGTETEASSSKSSTDCPSCTCTSCPCYPTFSDHSRR